MATFEAQVEALTGITISSSGTNPTQAELTQFLRDGVIDVINRIILIRPEELHKFANTTHDDSDSGITLTGKIISVMREHDSTSILRACDNISVSERYDDTDVNSLKYRSKYNPGYYILDKKIFCVPVSAGSNNDLVVTQVHYDETITYGSDDMQHFPREYIYLVPLYGGIKALENSMAGLEGDSDLSTAITAANTELDETQAVCDAINTNVDSAISELGEAATAVDAKIDTAADAITTAAGRINTAVALANLEFDKAEQEADAAEAEADDGAIATALTNINGNIDDAVTDIALAKAEATEMATQTDNSGDIATALTAINTELDKVDEVIVLASTEFDKCDTILDKGETDTEGDVNTALTAMNTELDKTQAIGDLINGEVDDAFAEVALAKVEAAELAVQTDNSGDFETALDALNTAVDKFRADGDDPALFGDQSQYTTGEGLTHVKDALELARDAIDTGFTTDEDSGSGDDATPKSAGYWLNDEDPEMVTATLSTAQTELQRAQVHIEEWNSTVTALMSEINGFATEVQARAEFSGAKSQAITAYLGTAQGYLGAAQGYASELAARIDISNGYAGEIHHRLAQAQAKREESSSRVELGTAYLNEAQNIIAQANGYATEAQARGVFTDAKFQTVQAYITSAGGFLQAAQGFAEEVAAYSASVNIFVNTTQNRINVGNAFLGEANASAMEVQAYVNEVSARAQQVSGYSEVVAGYLQAAQGFATELTSKVNIAQGYIAEHAERLQQISAEYQWKYQRHALLKRQYDEAFGLMVQPQGGQGEG